MFVLVGWLWYFISSAMLFGDPYSKTPPCLLSTEAGAPRVRQRRGNKTTSIVFGTKFLLPKYFSTKYFSTKKYFAHFSFPKLHFLCPWRTSLSVTKAQFRELRNSFKDIKPNLTAPRPTVNTAIKWPQLQLNSEEILMKKMYFWQRKSMFMPNQNQAKLFINTLLVTIELGASCKPMTLETACCCDVKLS